MRKLIILGLAIGIISTTINAQDFSVEKFELEELLDFPSGVKFAEEGSGAMWVLYNTTEGGSIVNKLLKYEAEEWEMIEFQDCNSCIRDIKRGPDDRLYIAGTDEGIYRRDGNQWEKHLEVEARGIEWLSDGTMVIINSEGIHTYDGENVLAGNNENLPEILNLNDLEVDRTDDVYIVLPSKLYLSTDEGWVQKTELATPMSIEVDSENRLWVTDNFGEIAYYQEGVYAGGQYNNFGTNDLAISQFDALWYTDSRLIRNEAGFELEIEGRELIEDAIVLNTVYVDLNNEVWVASNFKSGLAKVKYLGNPSSVSEATSKLEMKVVPNPAKDEVSITYEVFEKGRAEISVYDLQGSLVYKKEEEINPGINEVNVDLSPFENGVYFIDLNLGISKKTMKLVKI